jgi:hypothetical protein
MTVITSKLYQLALLHLFRLRPHFINIADIQERLLGQVVGLAVADFLEAAERVGDLRVDALLAGELLGNKRGWCAVARLTGAGVAPRAYGQAA